MTVSFKEDYLQELYETGKTIDKKHRFQPGVVKKYKYCIDLMKNVADTDGLKRYNGLNFEKLTGDKKELYSIRVNLRYRIEFTAKSDGIRPTLTICNIEELSNHYK